MHDFCARHDIFYILLILTNIHDNTVTAHYTTLSISNASHHSVFLQFSMWNAKFVSSGPAYSYIGPSIVIEKDSSEYGRYQNYKSWDATYLYLGLEFRIWLLMMLNIILDILYSRLYNNVQCYVLNLISCIQYTLHKQFNSDSFGFWKCERMYLQQANSQTGDIVHDCVCDFSVFEIFADLSFHSVSYPLPTHYHRKLKKKINAKKRRKTKYERKPLTENGNSNNNGIGQMHEFQQIGNAESPISSPFGFQLRNLRTR